MVASSSSLTVSSTSSSNRLPLANIRHAGMTESGQRPDNGLPLRVENFGLGMTSTTTLATCCSSLWWFPPGIARASRSLPAARPAPAPSDVGRHPTVGCDPAYSSHATDALRPFLCPGGTRRRKDPVRSGNFSTGSRASRVSTPSLSRTSIPIMPIPRACPRWSTRTPAPGCTRIRRRRRCSATRGRRCTRATCSTSARCRDRHRLHARGDPPGDPADRQHRVPAGRRREPGKLMHPATRCSCRSRRSTVLAVPAAAPWLKISESVATCVPCTRAWRSRSTRGWWRGGSRHLLRPAHRDGPGRNGVPCAAGGVVSVEVS